MPKCPNCGFTIKEGVPFCPHCGIRIKWQPEKRNRDDEDLEDLILMGLL